MGLRDCLFIERVCQKLLSIQSRHASGTGCSNRLPVNRVHRISGGEDTGHIRSRRVRLRLDIPHIIHIKHPFEEIRIGFMPDRNKDTGYIRKYRGLPCFGIPDPYSLNNDITQDFIQLRVPEKLDFIIIRSALLHRLRGSQLISAVQNGYFIRKHSQKSCLFHRSVPSAYHDHMLFSEECAVTGCASTHSFPFQFLFTWDVEPLSRGTRSDDDTFGIDSVLIIHRDFKRTFIKSDFRNKSISAIGTKTLRLLPKILHHTGPEYAFRIPREVFNIGGLHQLTARLRPFQNQWSQICPGSVECGRQSCRPASDDYYLKEFVLNLIHFCSSFYFFGAFPSITGNFRRYPWITINIDDFSSGQFRLVPIPEVQKFHSSKCTKFASFFKSLLSITPIVIY